MTIPAARSCPLCHGAAGYHVNHCPRHDEKLCVICRKIAAMGAARSA